MAVNQIIVEGTLKKGSDVFPNEKRISELVFIEYPEYGVMCATLLLSDDVTMNLLNNHIGEKVLITGRLSDTAVRVQDFSCLK